MKTKKIKVLVMATLATACIGAASMLWSDNVSASADTGFTMVSGASVRMDNTADESAIRFTAKVPDATDKGYRMLIFPTKIIEYAGQYNMTIDTNDVVSGLKSACTMMGLMGYIDGGYEDNFWDYPVTPYWDAEENSYIVRGAMKNVNASYYDEEYAGIAYYQSGSSYVYAGYENSGTLLTNARTVSYVGSAALNGGDYVVENDATTTAAQKSALEAFVKGKLGDTLTIKDSTEVTRAGDTITLATNATGLDVRYTSSDTEVLTVGETTGEVTFMKTGTATVTAKIGAESFTDTIELSAYEGDEWTNRMVAQNYTANMRNVSSQLVGQLDADVKKFADTTELPAPTGTSYTSYIDYSMTAQANKSDDAYVGNFINFAADPDSTGMVTRVLDPIPAKLYGEYPTIDWSDAYITFWIYNDNDATATLCGTDNDFDGEAPTSSTERLGSVITTIPSKTWTKVNVSLKDYCDVTSDVLGSGTYNIKLWFKYTDTAVDTDNYADFEWPFYVTGFEFRNISEDEAMNVLIQNNYSPSTLAINKYQRGALSSTVKEFGTNDPLHTTDVAAYSTYIAYTLAGQNTFKQPTRANFINFSAYTSTMNTMVTKAMPTELYEQYQTLDWANASVSFWIYNDTTVEAALFGTKTVSGTVSNTTDGVGSELQKIAAKTWTQVTLKLSDITSQYDVASGDYNIKLWFSVTDPTITEDNWLTASSSFYMTGFKFVAGSSSAE